MQLDSTSSAHFTLLVVTEGFLWLAEQFGFFSMVFVERKAPTIQRFHRQFSRFFVGVGTQFRETWVAHPARTEAASSTAVVSKAFMIGRPGIWVRGNEHRLLAPSGRQKSTLSIVAIEFF